jgi:hypothetical protein
LFIVHWLAAITPSAPYSALVTHMLVSTLPATTAAGGLGLSMQPSGTITCSGFRQPALSGMSSSTRVRNTYSTAAIVTALGALKLLGSCALVPLKSMVASRAGAVHGQLHAICAPLSSGSVNCRPSAP